jgi:hypothetical protein
VLSHGTYTGGFDTCGAGAELSCADALCLSDLTTNTRWRGYSTANSNGQLVAAKVHSFLCTNPACTNLMPLATYVFPNGGDSSAGGASFTTDASGVGPNDSADWSAANYFNGTYTYWTGNASNSATTWGTANSGTIFNACDAGGQFWLGGSGQSGSFGQSANTNGNRWIAAAATCNNSYQLICFVNP